MHSERKWTVTLVSMTGNRVYSAALDIKRARLMTHWIVYTQLQSSTASFMFSLMSSGFDYGLLLFIIIRLNPLCLRVNTVQFKLTHHDRKTSIPSLSAVRVFLFEHINRIFLKYTNKSWKATHLSKPIRRKLQLVFNVPCPVIQLEIILSPTWII